MKTVMDGVRYTANRPTEPNSHFAAHRESTPGVSARQIDSPGLSQQSEMILFQQSKKFLLETGKLSG
ncbi:MAG TPA: hypothetical protein VKF63_03910 [Terracidiphilus sp.]|nr:hypothetical protein [Terracidiphilus sp.]